MVRRSSPPPPRPVVLIVEDTPDVRLAYRFLLETSEFRVLEAADGAQALEHLGEEHVDVILTDIYMPGIDGIGLIRAVRSRPGRQPAIIAVSGEPHYAYRSSLQAARYIGADVILVKPIPREDLVRAIRSLIGGGPTLVERRSPPPN
jgi:two-component system, chemotaxis family, chemotaxis protein CheY